MPALVLLVNADRRTLRLTEAMLSEAGHLVAAVTSFGEAKQLLDSVTPDLLVADVHLGAFNGLHLAIRSRLDHPSVPVIVTHTEPDAIFEAEAKRHGADFMVAPIENPDFMGRVNRALAERRRAQSPVRRWSRKHVSRDVRVGAADARARVIDMSYGGVRLAFPEEPDIPSVFEITLPAGARIKAHRVWTGHSSGDDQFWCGAELDDLPAPDWRQFVDSVAPEG